VVNCVNRVSEAEGDRIVGTLRKRVEMLLVLALTLCAQLCWAGVAGLQGDEKALKLDGDGDFVEVPHSRSLDITGAVSIEAWVKCMSASLRSAVVVVKGAIDAEWGGYSLSLSDDGHVVFSCGKGSTMHLTSNSTVSTHYWHHVACVLRGNGVDEAEIWMNGLLDTTGTIGYPTRTPGNLRVGELREGTGFDGEIDEVRIYRRALTEEEIESEMGREGTRSEEAIVAHYDFDELTPDGNVKDLSRHGNHGTLRGEATLVPSTAPVFSSDEAASEMVENLISLTERRMDQLRAEDIEISSVSEGMKAARNALQNGKYKAAFGHAQSAHATLDEIWDMLQNYAAVRTDVELTIKQLKKRKINTSVIEAKIAEAGEALKEEAFDGAAQLIADARFKADEAWSTSQQIEELRERIEDVEDLGCDAGDAKKKMREAVDALNKGGYSRVARYVEDGIVLAMRATCGRVEIMDLVALAPKYDGKTVEITGEIKNIEAVQGKGYKMAIDDGTGLIWVEHQGSMKDLDYWDKVIIEGVFSEENGTMSATKVRKANIYDR